MVNSSCRKCMETARDLTGAYLDLKEENAGLRAKLEAALARKQLIDDAVKAVRADLDARGIFGTDAISREFAEGRVVKVE